MLSATTIWSSVSALPEPPHREASASFHRHTARPCRCVCFRRIALRTGVKPSAAQTALELLKRAGTSMVAVKAMDTTGPIPGTVIKRRHTCHLARSPTACDEARQTVRAASGGLEKRVDYLGEFRHAVDELACARLEPGCTDGS